MRNGASIGSTRSDTELKHASFHFAPLDPVLARFLLRGGVHFCNIRVPSIAASRPRMRYATSYRTDENHLLTLET
jgi:hypothetical protein